jgi:tyrosine-protein phosphatase YwqE
MPRTVVNSRKQKSFQFATKQESEFSGVLSYLTAGELLIEAPSIRYLEETRYPGTGWVLVEFAERTTWFHLLFQIKRILSSGYFPLIAHPERYRWCRSRKERLIKLSKMGCGVLVSARSLRLAKYSAAASQLLQEGLCHALASDVHSPRDFILDDQLKEIVEKTTILPWQLLTMEMPDRILNDMKLPELPLLKRVREV